MNVWIVNHYALPPEMPGGTRHYSLAKELVRRGHRVVILAASFDHVTRREDKLSPGQTWRTEDTDGVTFIWLRTPGYRSSGPARVWNMLVFAARVALARGLPKLPKPDVVMGSSPHLFAAWAAMRVAHRRRVPFILEVRDIWPQSLVDLGGFTPAHPFIRMLGWLEHDLYRRAHKIVALLPAAKEHMVANGAEPGKVVWLPNGVDLSLVPSPEPPRVQVRFTVMYAGTHGLANGLDTVLDAASVLQREGWDERVQFRLVGDGPEKSRLMKRAAEEGLHMVRFEPPVPKRSVYSYMQQADAFLMVLKDSPVFRFGVSPNKLFDYLASARPVIFGVSTSNNPVALAGAGITVPAGDHLALAAAVKELASIPLAERIAMGERGRRYVEENHDLVRLGEKLERVISALALEGKS